MNFDDDISNKLLKSLMLKNYKIIDRINTPDSQLFLNTDIFAINDNFSSNTKRITLPTPILEDTYKKEIVQEDRSIAIEACIVRIMKSRKRCDHNSLVQEVISTLQMFKPHP